MKKYLLILLLSTFGLIACDNKPKPIEKQEDISPKALEKKALFLAKQTNAYKDAFIKVTKIKIDLDLTHAGKLDSDVVINEYNESIGETYGWVLHVYEVRNKIKERLDTSYLRKVQVDVAAKLLLQYMADLNSQKK